MPFTELQRRFAITVAALALAACATSPGKKEDTDASAKVAEKADAALGQESKSDSSSFGGSLFSGSLFGGKSKREKAEDEEVTDDADAATSVAAPKAKSLPMVLAPDAEKQAKKAKSQYAQAMTALKAGNEDQALVLLRDLSNRYPDLSGPLLNQAILLRKKGRLEEAQELLKKSMMSPTQNPRVMNELGVVSRELGNFKQAKAAYESAIRLAPGYDRAHYNLAVLADLYLSDTALAIKEFEMFQSLQDTRDKKVDGWLKELKRRAGTP